jgi:hypothetical protein
VINQKAEWSGDNQIVIPTSAYARLHDPVVLVRELKNTTTRYLFTWGHRETGAYRIEAEEQRSCSALKVDADVRCVFHDGGHVFPVADVQAFLRETIGRQ